MNWDRSILHIIMHIFFIKTVLKHGVFSHGIESENPSRFFIDALHSHILSLCLY